MYVRIGIPHANFNEAHLHTYQAMIPEYNLDLNSLEMTW